MEAIVLNIFLIIIAICLFYGWLKIYIRKRKCNVVVEGSITDVKTIHLIGSIRGSHCKYFVNYNNKEYELEDDFYESSSKVKVGDKVLIYIDKDNINTFISPSSIRKSNLYLVCLVFCIICFFLVLFDL